MKFCAIFFIALTLFCCSKYDPQEDLIMNDFTLELLDTSGVLANGASHITIRLRNTLPVKEGLRVLFSSSQGTLLSADQPYTGNVAETQLSLTEDTGPYYITATIKEGEVKRIEKSVVATFSQAYPNSGFSLIILDSTNVRQDGFSLISVLFSGMDIQKEGLTVHFESSQGELIQSDLPYFNQHAQGTLTVARTSGIYVVKAQLKEGMNVKAEKSITFSLRRAYADRIEVELDKSVWSLMEPVGLKTFLTRSNGFVTTGQQVWFSAQQIDSLGHTLSVGRFEGTINNASNANGQLNDIKLHLDTHSLDTAYAVQIIAKTLNDTGDTLTHTSILPYK